MGRPSPTKFACKPDGLIDFSRYCAEPVKTGIIDGRLWCMSTPTSFGGTRLLQPSEWIVAHLISGEIHTGQTCGSFGIKIK